MGEGVRRTGEGSLHAKFMATMRVRIEMEALPTTMRWERGTSARFWSAPVLWRFPTRSKAAEDCRPSSVAALRRVDSPRRWREDQRSFRSRCVRQADGGFARSFGLIAGQKFQQFDLFSLGQGFEQSLRH